MNCWPAADFVLHSSSRIAVLPQTATARPVNLQLLRLHLSQAGKCTLRIGRQRRDPFAQHILMEIEITRHLRNLNTPCFNQSHHLKPELAAELSSLHFNSPVP
jgi:hypothetical protein